MKRFCFLTLLLVILAATDAWPDEVGRYQFMDMSYGESPAVFIIDTKEGHLWLWVTAVIGSELRTNIIYQGKLKPGSKMGETIDHSTIALMTLTRETGENERTETAE